MSELRLETNCLGFELHDDDQLVALYRATEELPRDESPKPCFAPIYTPSGKLITGYRPKDHLWHTGLCFGWTHVNEVHNFWGGSWYSAGYSAVPAEMPCSMRPSGSLRANFPNGRILSE